MERVANVRGLGLFSQPDTVKGAANGEMRFSGRLIEFFSPRCLFGLVQHRGIEAATNTFSFQLILNANISIRDL